MQYNQVPRILNPVVLALDALPQLYKDAHVKVHIDSIYGDIETARSPSQILLPPDVCQETSTDGCLTRRLRAIGEQPLILRDRVCDVLVPFVPCPSTL